MTSTTLAARLPGGALLPAALKLDAVVTAANGAAYLVAAGPLSDLLGLSEGVLRGAGAFLVVFAACVWASAAAGGRGARAIVAANVAWALASVACAVAAVGSPTTAGTVWIVLQAVVVAGFAELQIAGLRRRG
jgi:hypothetical protein